MSVPSYDALLELDGVVKAFRSEPPVRPLDGLSLTVRAGELVCVTGVSGKGKSTLLNVAGGLLRPDQGTVRFKGDDLYGLAPHALDALHRCGIGFVFQSPYLFQALTARENLTFALGLANRADADGLADEALKAFGLLERADHLPCELSVGQRRRLVIARALQADHDLILADEPTNDLDESWSETVFARLRAFADAPGKAVVLVTHDAAYARRADRVCALEHGVLVETS